MIKLYKFGSIGDVCDASPFCVKIEAYLRLADLPYEALCGAQYLRKAPKGKLPFIEDNGKIIADSNFILKYLKETYGDTLDGDLSDADKAIAHAFIKMIDENLYWVLVHARWKLDNNWAILR
jgi:glutathione S-transferase